MPYDHRLFLYVITGFSITGFDFSVKGLDQEGPVDVLKAHNETLFSGEAVKGPAGDEPKLAVVLLVSMICVPHTAVGMRRREEFHM